MLRKKLAGFLGILMVSVSVLAGCSDAKADKAALKLKLYRLYRGKGDFMRR